MGYSYKNNLREGVIFAFSRDGKLLIEHRPGDNGEEETFFTNGSIETKDYGTNTDYRIVALNREVGEEMDNKIAIKIFHYLGELKVEAIGVIFYIYLITDWKGDMPDHTIEDGQKFSRLQWVDLSKADDYFKYDSAKEICDKIRTFLAR